MISVDGAFEAYANRLGPLPSRLVQLAGARGRVLRAAVVSRTDLPPFTQSAMDGYAVSAADLTSASQERPAMLRIAFEVAAGDGAAAGRAIDAGEAARIFTGAPLPRGADAVVRQEDVEREGESIRLVAPVPPGRDIRVQGEELAEGAALAGEGVRLTPGRLAALAIAGIDELSVTAAPRVRVLVTGDEIVPAGEPLGPGQVYDANRVLTEAWFAARGISDLVVEHVPDDRRRTVDAMIDACGQADLVVTTGGVSVGDHDHVIGGLDEVGARQVFWKVRQKPGKPLLFAMRGEVPIVGLPGNPASVFAGLQVHVSRVLDLLEGETNAGDRRTETGELSAAVRRGGGRETWLRCALERVPEGLPRLAPLPAQSSHMLSNLFRCEALARIPQGEGELDAGVAVPFVSCL